MYFDLLSNLFSFSNIHYPIHNTLFVVVFQVFDIFCRALESFNELNQIQVRWRSDETSSCQQVGRTKRPRRHSVKAFHSMTFDHVESTGSSCCYKIPDSIRLNVEFRLNRCQPTVSGFCTGMTFPGLFRLNRARRSSSLLNNKFQRTSVAFQHFQPCKAELCFRIFLSHTRCCFQRRRHSV